MKIDPQHVPVVLVDFMEKHILPKATGWQKFAVGASMFALTNRAQGIVSNSQNIEAMKMLGIIGSDGFLDVDYAREMALEAMKKAGGKLPVMGYVLDSSDIEALYETAKIVRTE